MAEQPAPIVIVVLGPPGAGKGTQSSMLANLLLLPHISIGSLLRSYARDGSEVGLRLRGMMALGSLVPDNLVLDVLATRISKPDCARGLILDGCPRTLVVARLSGRRICSYCGATYHLGTQPPRVSGECDFDGSALTLREDDRKATVLKRLQIYQHETAPILSHYAEKASLLEVDGERPKENIAQEFVVAIQNMLHISIAGARNT